MIRLNPFSFEISDWENYNYFLYMICEDYETAALVQKLEMPDDKAGLIKAKLSN